MAFSASAATSSTGLLTARRARPASLHMAELVNSLISSGCLRNCKWRISVWTPITDPTRNKYFQFFASPVWPLQAWCSPLSSPSQDLSKEQQALLVQLGVVHLRASCRLLTTDSIPTSNNTAEARDQCPGVSFLPSQERGEAWTAHSCWQPSWSSPDKLSWWGRAVRSLRAGSLVWFTSVFPNPAQPTAQALAFKVFVNAYWLGYYTFYYIHSYFSSKNQLRPPLSRKPSLVHSGRATASPGLLHLLSSPLSITLTTLFISPSLPEDRDHVICISKSLAPSLMTGIA